MRLLALALVAFVLASGCARPAYEPAAPVEVPPKGRFTAAWPDLEAATIRPGVLVLTPMEDGGVAACTSNFLFRNPDNSTLYLGVAAHCFGIAPETRRQVGDQVDLVATDGAQVARAGRVAYNGWLLDDAPANDFGLIELRSDPSIRNRVHPAMIYYGGPTRLADSQQATPGTHVLTYGHSVQRPPDDPENPREGYVLQHEGGRTTVVTEHPGIQGDSGSGLMTKDGGALGVLSMGTTNPTGGLVANRDFPSVNYYVDLDKVLAYAITNGPPELAGLELVPWSLLRQAELPL